MVLLAAVPRRLLLLMKHSIHDQTDDSGSEHDERLWKLLPPNLVAIIRNHGYILPEHLRKYKRFCA